MSLSIIRPLADLRGADIGFSGGKGAHLGELLAAGFPVPDGFVIGAPAYRQSVGAAHPAPSREVREGIVAHYRAMGPDVIVAVRSSGVGEDGATASHAGIYETVLNVRGITQLLDAVANCWASASSLRARSYHDAHGWRPEEHGMAVVVQRQIHSSCAGVAFTVDPVTGCADRIILESAVGLGQAVVDGRVIPDRVIVDKASLGIVAVECGSGDALSGNGFREVAGCARGIEQWYGSPQDIEWALDEHGQVWILQARPISTCQVLEARTKAVEFYDPPRPPESRWTRVNIAEALPGVPTPLTWSVWRTGLGEGQRRCQIRLGVVSRHDNGPLPFTTLARGWPVLSVDLLVSQVARIPGMDPSAFSQQMLGSAEHVDPAPVRARIATALRMVTRAPVALALQGRRLRAASVTSRWAWQRDAWRRPEDPVALLTEAVVRFQRTMTIHAVQTYLSQALYQAVEAVAGGLTVGLLSGDGDLPEAHLIRDLQLLSSGRISLGRFLFEHGFHGPDEGEIAAASWRQNAEPVLHAARLWGADRPRDPVAAVEQRSDERRRTEAALCASLPRARRGAVARLIAVASTALVGREIGKTAFLQDLDVARHAVSFLGDDAVWHTLGELQANTRLSTAELVARRRIRAQYAAQEPPLSFTGDLVNRTAGAEAGSQSVIAGIGASSGRARGRARVVTNPSESVVFGVDDVLIARTTDPSWVVRFMAVAGMVIDVGGTLSHAAIIARELGVPCVIGTGNGTELIPDGALVEIDGTHGTVRILAAATDRSGNA